MIKLLLFQNTIIRTMLMDNCLILKINSFRVKSEMMILEGKNIISRKQHQEREGIRIIGIV